MTREPGSTLRMKKGSKLIEQPKQATNYSQISSYWTKRQKKKVSKHPPILDIIWLFRWVIGFRKLIVTNETRFDELWDQRLLSQVWEQPKLEIASLGVYNHNLFKVKTLTLQQRQRSDPSQKSPDSHAFEPSTRSWKHIRLVSSARGEQQSDQPTNLRWTAR